MSYDRLGPTRTNDLASVASAVDGLTAVFRDFLTWVQLEAARDRAELAEVRRVHLMNDQRSEGC